MFRKSLIVLAMLAVLPSCLDDATKPVKEAPTSSTWPDMTSKDGPILGVVWCYNEASAEDVMTKYESILHSEYFFQLSPEDLDPGEDAVITRAEDIALTELIFENQTMLELVIIEGGFWYEITELEGSPCGGCQETTRQYFIRAQFGRDGTILQSPPESAYVTIIIAPDESDSSKWVVRAIYDLAM